MLMLEAVCSVGCELLLSDVIPEDFGVLVSELFEEVYEGAVRCAVTLVWDVS